jgi:flagellin-like protein
MRLKQLFADDNAVSPVIGVILMVAITVILAAVIASFVLGLGNQANQGTPTATIGMDYEQTGTFSNGTGYGPLTLSHDGGDTLDASNLYVRGSGFNGTLSGADVKSAGSWVQSGSPYGSGSEIQSGQTLDVAVQSDYEISVIWQSAEGDTSSTLNEQSGPDA